MLRTLLSIVIIVGALVSVCRADWPTTSCGTAPQISGGYACSYSSPDGQTYTFDYTCTNDCNNKVGSITCKAGNTKWSGAIPQCLSANGKPSPCPVDIPEDAPYSKIFDTSKCQDYPGSSDLLCRENVDGAKVLTTSISQVLQAHNCWRHNVNPPAAKMPDLQWDNELAALAERWAAQCPPSNDPHTPGELNFVAKSSPHGKMLGVGQNFAGVPRPGGWPQAVDMWASERKDWQYGQQFDFSVGHWTQIIWANSLYVGCARVRCPNVPWIVYYCNYAPAGNWMDQQPYELANKAAGRSRNRAGPLMERRRKKRRQIKRQDLVAF